MKLLRILLAMVMAMAVARAEQETFYLGTYTNHSGSKGIYRDTIDSETGKLGPVVFAAPAIDPSFIALSPDQRTLYAAEETPGPGYVKAFARANDGSLRPLNRPSAGGSGTCHVAVDPTDRWVLVANYGSGSVACFRLRHDGAIGPRTGFIRFAGSGPNAQRQEGSHAHQVNFIGHNIFVCDLGADRLWNLALNASTGTLAYQSPGAILLPPGSGPRHLVSAGDRLYVADELAGTVTVFVLRNGQATILQTIASLPEAPIANSSAPAEIAIGRSGKILYVSNRGNDTISVFKIAANGLLKFDEFVSSGVKGPRSFAIDPSGRWMIVAGQNDNHIVVLAINPDSGELGSPKNEEEAGSPVCVLFASPPK